MAVMRIKTPTKNWDVKKKVEFNEIFANEITSKVAMVVLPQLSRFAQAAINRQISIMATFFQRVVARTPVDEGYKRSDKMIKDRKTGRLKPDYHIPDYSVCRDAWYITDGQKKITAAQMRNIDRDLFWDINNKHAINEIKKILKQTFNITDKTVFTIGNNNDHFKGLEEGFEDWEHDRIVVKKGTGGIKRDHGVKNKHSIQAPVGMWRITMAELEVIKNSNAISPLTSRYRSQNKRIMDRVPSNKQLSQFVKLLQTKGYIEYKDIERYLEKY